MIGRLTGAAIFIIAAFYSYAATGYEAGFGDPLGPKAFPLLLSIPTMVIGLSLVVWPGSMEPWGEPRRLLIQAAAVATLFGFVIFLEPIGYVPSTVAMISILAMLMQARPAYALLAGLISAPALWLLFDRFLDLPLPFFGTWMT